MLAPSGTAKLVRLLLHGENTSFGAIWDAFVAAFPQEEQFDALCAAVLLLEDTRVLKVPQRLAAWYVTHACYAATGPATANPFVSQLVKAASGGHGTGDVERNLVLQLLYGYQLQELRQQTPQGYVLGHPTHMLQDAPGAATLQQQYLSGAVVKRDALSSHARVGLPGVLAVPTAPLIGAQNAAAAAAAAGAPAHAAAQAAEAARNAGLLAEATALVGVLNTAHGRGFEPAWARPVPPVMAPLMDELWWAGPELHTGLVWDSSIGEEGGGRCAAVCELLGKALRGPLLPAQQQAVLAELEADPRLVHRLGLAPRHLPLLVEHTPVVAYELLMRLMRSPRVHAFLAVLARTDMSLHSMEVVNRLTASVALPTEFVHLYITNCINSCESTQDKYVQNRLVRLVCVFLQSLIRNRIVNIQDLLHEVQSFCINFSRIREAAKLFRLLKQIESGGRGMQGDGGLPSSPTHSERPGEGARGMGGAVDGPHGLMGGWDDMGPGSSGAVAEEGM